MFGNFQKRIISWALTCLAAMVVLGSLGGVFVLGAKFLSAFSAVVWPLAIAIILSLLLQPVCDFFEKEFKFPRGLSVASLFVLVVLAAAGLAFLLIPLCVREVGDFLGHIPVLWERAMARFPELDAWVNEYFRRENIREMLAQSAAVPGQVKALLAAWLPHIKALLQKSGVLFGQIAAAASIPIYLYYLMAERRDLIGIVERESKAVFSERVAQDIAFLVRQFRDILIAFFRGQVVIGLLYGVILAAGFGALQIPGGILIGLAIGLMNIVPYLGTLVGLSLILPLAFLSGGIWLAAGALAAFCVAQLIESYFLTPKIMGKRTGLHPMVIMVAIFFWATALDGVLGMVLAVPLTAFFVVFWRLFKERYLPSIVHR
ncbi:MAG: AI-2E family transporter [Opitutales bacterium]|nr:AI-2E family transporter [Opitutales bacterium]